MSERLTPENQASLERLVERAGVIGLPQRTLIDVSGNDRHKFLHNLCTNDVKSLAQGEGCEAFFCTVQGKILAHAFVLCDVDRLLISTAADQSPRLMAHLDKYLISDDVVLTDQSDLVSHWLVAGRCAESQLSEIGVSVPGSYLAHVTMPADHAEGMVCCRVDMAGANSFLVFAATKKATTLAQTFADYKFEIAEPAVWHPLRIAAGFPLFGVDIEDSHLPQEVGRDAQAISFTKGCYLGQETVARIDALGHVNWNLVRLRIDGEQLPDAGTEVKSGDRVVGTITSSAYSAQHQSVIGMARVRREQASSGTELVVVGEDVSAVITA